jgi:hypothetical protein
MPDRPSQGNRNPVTLVVMRDDHEGGVLSWTFPNEDAAMSVIRVFRQDERWLLIRGVYESGAMALKAARVAERVLKENRPSGLIRRCDAAPAKDDDHRSSA